MAQGLIKKASTAAKSVHQQKKALGKTKRGGTAIAPKNLALVRQKALTKKLSAGTMTDTERQMAAKAGSTGKLTIMRPIADRGLKDIVAEKKKKGLIKAAEAKKMAAAVNARPTKKK
ncbi:hypothetical protein HDU81_007022 [Chytriomyces hyalinus]|nr:hypothetical protein BJ741DRAFT_264327 [Chytriomyces cf. hyalinus JEL632]KAJ3226888.1 hypothetical protein HDU81_007022 [Chytriomyces hyalinus]KAJ3245303.1 hypothetical protein HDU78_009548 [Chytriomyces hyalinus]KAJ3252141.1 hypothetical protein HDU77_005294 [Chytriomyces hyalinus]KAJ3407189.1 hypothetical protein HDU80_009450 [Chytriomyces hyalinus]